MFWLGGISGSILTVTSGDFITGLGHSGPGGRLKRLSVSGTLMQFTVSGSSLTRAGTFTSDSISKFNDLNRFCFLSK
jgi:zinc transporter ZupT